MLYLRFSGDHYYPHGGAYDCDGVFATLEAAQDMPYVDNAEPPEWAHIATITGGQLVITHEMELDYDYKPLPPMGDDWPYDDQGHYKGGTAADWPGGPRWNKVVKGYHWNEVQHDAD